MLDIATRMLIEWAQKAAGTHDAQRADDSADVASYDTSSFPIELDLPSRPRSAATVELVTVHVTDVAGGFGVAASAVKRWRGLLERGKVPPDLLVQLPDPSDLGGSSFLLALLERYSRCAYHWIGSRRAGSVRNHPATLRTSHGNGGNRGMGWALDAGHGEMIGRELAAAGARSLTGCIAEAHKGSGVVIDVVPHRAFSADRRVDTDAHVWQTVVLPVVRALGPSVCRVNYELAEGGGRPVPRSWDAEALFDDKGKRLSGGA